jgi:TolB-like protein/Tfp pilus assembly protein PilF
MNIWSELRRRNVPRMAVLYFVSSWLVLQVTDVLTGLIVLPDWVGPLVLTMLVTGFPIALVLSWFFEIGESGITRDTGAQTAVHDAAIAGRRMDFVIIAILSAAILVFAWLSWSNHGPAEKSIAVLAFANVSDDPAQDYFSEGISEEILGALAKSPELRVISRSSSFSFRGTNLDVPTIAKQLGVAHILEGSVRKSGNQVRISAQLIDAATDLHLWSDTYERELTAANVFDIQSQIANNIAESLNAVLDLRDKSGTAMPPTTSLPALEAYLLGKQRMASRSRQGLVESVAYFETAIGLDPDYAPAYLGLADANLLLAQYGHIAVDQALQRAKTAIDRSIALDDDVGAAYASLGLMRSQQGDIRGAESALLRAIALDPNDAKAYHWYGDILIYQLGDPGTAIAMLRKAQQLDPLSPVIVLTLGEAYSTAGQLAEGLRQFRKVLQIDRNFASAFSMLGIGYLSLDDLDKADYWFEAGAQVAPDEFQANGFRTFLYRARGQEERAVELAYKLQSLVPGNNLSLVTLVSFGHDEEAIALAETDWPSLSCKSAPAVQRSNIYQAMNLSLAYERTGQRECAASLLNGISGILEVQPGSTARAFGFLEAEVYTRKGEIERALVALRASVDAGMRSQWMVQVEQSPHAARLRDAPEYLAIQAKVRADLERQLAIAREMEARGDLAPLGE